MPVLGVNVTEHQPAHGGIHVQGLAGASRDPGQAVVGAEGGQTVADTEDPGQVVDDHNRGIRGDLRADRPAGAEVQGAVEDVAESERRDVGHGDAHRQGPAQPAVKSGQQQEVDGEGKEVDDREPEQARGDDPGQAEWEPAHAGGHDGGEPLPPARPSLRAHQLRPRHEVQRGPRG